MNNLIIYTAVFIILIFILILFSVFAIGFLIGYILEDKNHKQKKPIVDTKEVKESDREKKTKKEWRKFLEYDGSAPQEKI